MTARPAQERLGRLLAIVPWVAASDGPEVTEVCSRFGITERDLLADLDLLFVCGVHPFTPDTLIEVDVADGRVWIRYADYFRRPLRLTPPEGLALVSAGAAMLAVPDADADGALARALSKLSEVLGVSGDDAVDVDLGPVRPGVLATARRAAESRRRIRIDYYSLGRDGRSVRVVQPWRVYHEAGWWYLDGWCETVQARRLFRVDRISEAELLDGTFDPPDDPEPRRRYQPDPDDPLIVLDLDPAAHWIAERYPNDGVESLPGDRLRVRLRSAQRAWLERLLLQAGAAAVVVEGDVELRPGAARRVLARYRP